jgi:hypothetical protein
MRSLALLLIVGCRSYAVPSVPPPVLPPAPSLEIKSHTERVSTGTRDVCDGESRCRTEDKTDDQERSEIRLNGTRITYGQLRVLDAPDGDYKKALTEYTERSQPCRSARKFLIGGLAATIVGGVVLLIDAAPTGVRIGGAVVAAAGIGMLVLHHEKTKGCDEVYRFYKDNQLDLAETYTLIDRRKELDEIAARFNAQHGGGQPSETK